MEPKAFTVDMLRAKFMVLWSGLKALEEYRAPGREREMVKRAIVECIRKITELEQC